jgi:hypothetical protein
MKHMIPIWVWVENGIVVKAEVYTNGENKSLKGLLRRSLETAEKALLKKEWVHKPDYDWFTSPGNGVACFEFEPKIVPAYA